MIEVSRLVREFLARGGKVEQVPRGVFGDVKLKSSFAASVARSRYLRREWTERRALFSSAGSHAPSDHTKTFGRTEAVDVAIANGSARNA